jgi:hypothetical protein
MLSVFRALDGPAWFRMGAEPGDGGTALAYNSLT